MKICYIYIGALQNGNIQAGFHSIHRKYHKSRRVNQVLKHIINRGNEVIPINIKSYLGQRSNPYISYGVGACTSLFQALRTQADIYLADYLEAGILAYMCKVKFRQPFVFDYRDNFTELAQYGPTSRSIIRDRYITYLEKIVLNLADKVIAATEDLWTRCTSFGVENKKVVTIPLGVDTEMFNPSINGEKMRKKFGLTKPTIIYVGKMESHYHLDVLINAFSYLIKKEPFSKFFLVGDGRDLEKLKTYSKKLGLQDSIVFAGFQPHNVIPQLINAADVAVCPYYSGLKVYEYMACGKPIVKPRARRNEILEHMESAFLVKERTPQEFARGMMRVSSDEQLSEKMGKNARKLAVENYDWELIVDNYLETLQKVIYTR